MIRDRNDFAGVILAGGQSSRMGFPKEALKFKGKKVMDIILDIFRPLFGEILIITDDKNRLTEFKHARVIEDLVKGCGPLGGIYTGLKAASKDWAFFVACDMPFLHTALINRLLNNSKKGEYSCIIPYTEKGIEPLHAVYSKAVLPELENILDKGEFSIRQLLRNCNCKYIKSNKNESSSFCNINTPEDLKKMEAKGVI